MAKFTADSLREKAQEVFEDVTLELNETEKVVFQHVMRLSKAERAKILALVDEISKEDEDEEKSSDVLERLEKAYSDILASVANDKAKARAVLKKLDVPQLNVLFDAWLTGSKLGEASSSQS